MLRETFGQRTLQLFLDRGLDTRLVLRRKDRAQREAAVVVLAGKGEGAAHVVAQALAFAHTLPQTRVAGAAENGIGHLQRGQVGVLVRQRQRQLRGIAGIGLVGRAIEVALRCDGHQRLRQALIALRAGRGLAPVAKGGGQGALGRRDIDVADGRELALRRAEEAAMEVAQLRHRDAAHVLHRFVEAVGVAQVAARIRIAMARDAVGGHGLGFLALLLDACEGLLAQLFQRLGRVGGLAQQAADQLDGGRQVLALAAHRDLQHLPAGAEIDARLQLVQAVGDLLPRQAGAPFVQQRGGEAGHQLLPEQALATAVAQAQRGVGDAATGAFGQEGDLQPRHRRASHRARVEVGRRGLEGLGLRRGRVALVAGHQRGHVHPRRLRRTLGLRGGQVEADGAVVRPQPGRGHTLQVGQRGGAHLVALQEEEPPVATADGLGNLHADALGVGAALLPLVEPGGARTLQFLGRHRLGAQGIDRGHQLGPGKLHVLAGRQASAQQQWRGFGQRPRKGEGLRRQRALVGAHRRHQPLVQAATGGVAQHQ